MVSTRFSLLGCWLTIATATALQAGDNLADESTTASIQSISVEPKRVELSGSNRQQYLLVSGQMADGRLIDLSRVARFNVADGNVARVDGHRAVGIANGETRLTISVASSALELPVRVAGFDRYPPVHFANDIVPLFSRLGCNGGGCHGKATGQNGFKLSVFGFDPAADYGALVKEARGRRVFPAGPEKSLVLEKALAEVPHGGGRRMEPGSAEHELLLEWIKQGLPVGDSDAPRPTRLHVSPDMRVLRFGGEQQILATVDFFRRDRARRYRGRPLCHQRGTSGRGELNRPYRRRTCAGRSGHYGQLHGTGGGGADPRAAAVRTGALPFDTGQ